MTQAFEMREANEEFLTENEKRSRVIGLSEGELRRCRRLFRVFDKDHDGAIDYKELMALLKSIGCPATRDTAISMIADLDGDGNGNVEYPEFLEVMVHDSDERNDAWQCVIDTLCQDPDFNKRRDEARKHVKTALLSSRIRPESKKRCTLDALVALSITYFYVIILLENVGKCAFTYDTWKIGPEVFCTLVFWLDSFFIMNTAVTHELGVRLLTDRKSIMRKYYKSGQMLCDLVSAFPLDLVFPVWPVSRILRHLRMVKMTRFSSLFFIENTGLMSPQLVVFYFRVVPLFLNAIYCVFVLHTFAVIWLFLQPDDYSYLNSLYYILYTLTTVGYGDIDVDGIAVKVYACFLLVVGACLNGLTIGYLTAFIMRSDISGDKVDKMRQTLAVLRHFQVPSSLQEEILSYQYHVLDHNLGVAYTDVIAGLPPAMQQQVSLYMRVRLVNQVPMFTVCELSVQIALAQSLKNIVVPPEEYIMVAGEEGSEMFFLSHGFCDVLASNGYLLATITKGGFFGEVALLVETERHTNVKALTFCDLFILERREFNLILDRFPSFASHIHDEIELQAGGEAKTETTALLAMDETEPPTPEHIFPDAPMLDDDEIKTEPSDTIVGELKANTGENQNNSDLFERGNSNSGVSLTGAPKRRTSGPAGGAGVDVMSKLKQMRHKTSMASPNPLTMPVTPTNGDIGSDNDPVTPQRVSRAKSKSDDDFETQSFHSRKSRVMSRCGDDDDDDDEDRDKALTSFKSFRRQQQSGLQSGRSVQLSRSNSMKGRSDSGGGDAKMLRQLYETTQILRYSVDGLLTEVRELRSTVDVQAKANHDRFVSPPPHTFPTSTPPRFMHLHKLVCPESPVPGFEEEYHERPSSASTNEPDPRKRTVRNSLGGGKRRVMIGSTFSTPATPESKPLVPQGPKDSVTFDEPFAQSQCGTPALNNSKNFSMF